jgi:hypothetical protein
MRAIRDWLRRTCPGERSSAPLTRQMSGVRLPPPRPPLTSTFGLSAGRLRSEKPTDWRVRAVRCRFVAGRKTFRAGAWRLTVEGPPKDPITGKRRKINRTVREPNTQAGAKAADIESARLIVEVDFERRRPSALRHWRRSLVSGSLGLAGCDLRAATPWVGLCSPCEPGPASAACRCSLQLTVRPASRRTMRAIYETVPRRESWAASLGLWRPVALHPIIMAVRPPRVAVRMGRCAGWEHSALRGPRNAVSHPARRPDIVVTADDDGASQEQLWAAVGLFDPDAWASMCARIGATGSAIPTVTNGSSTVRRRGSRTNPAMDRTS